MHVKKYIYILPLSPTYWDFIGTTTCIYSDQVSKVPASSGQRNKKFFNGIRSILCPSLYANDVNGFQMFMAKTTIAQNW